MPLAMAPVGEELKITKVITDEKTKRHLENLGILVGGSIELISSSQGDLIVKVKDGRLALNRQVATRIFVA